MVALAAASLITAASLIAGCTAGPGSTGATGGVPTRPGAQPRAESAVLSASAERVVVLADTAPGALSVAVSRALFGAAPVVVVAAAGDRAGVRTGVAYSERLGAPLLLADPPSARPATVPSTSPPAAAPSGLSPVLAGEIRRLRPRTVLAAAPALASGLRALPGVTVVTDQAAVPGVTRPPGLRDFAVLVAAGGDAATQTGAAAATATAHAAGAQVVPVHGGDPRADPSAIDALARLRPARVLAAGGGFGPAGRLAARVAVAATGVQLPGGGQVMFPGRRLVALYGHPGAPALGVLGEQGLDAAIRRARTVAAPYTRLSDVPVIPAFEIITTVATGAAGPDGDYSNETSVDDLRPWASRAGAAGMYLVLDLQPGRTDFLTQAKRYAPLLQLPNVGLALDPEWRLGPNQRHLEQIGSVGVQEINAVSDWLARLTAEHHLPQKLLVLHQFRLSMIRGEAALDTDHDELATLIHMDGQGPAATKNDTWRTVTGAAPPGVRFGWKNFYDEDKPMFSPTQTMAKRPTPVMISYQ